MIKAIVKAFVGVYLSLIALVFFAALAARIAFNS